MALSILAFFLLLGSLSEAASKEQVTGDLEHRGIDHESGETTNGNLKNADNVLKWPYPNFFGNPLPDNTDVLPQIQNSLGGLHTGQGTIISLIGSILSILQEIREEQWKLRSLIESHSHSLQQNTQIPPPISVNTLTNVPKEDVETTAASAEASPAPPNQVAGESAIDKPPGLDQVSSSYMGGGNISTGGGAVPDGQYGGGTWWTSVSNGPNAGTAVVSGSGVGTYSGPQNGVAAGTGGSLGNENGPYSVGTGYSTGNGPGVATGSGGSFTIGSSSGNAQWGSGHWETAGGGTQGGNGSWWTSVSNGPNGGTTILSGSGFGTSSNPQNVAAMNTPQGFVGDGSSPQSGIVNGQGVGTAVGGGAMLNSGQVSGISPGIAPYFGGPTGWWSGLSTSTNNAIGPNGGFVGIVTNSQIR